MQRILAVVLLGPLACGGLAGEPIQSTPEPAAGPATASAPVPEAPRRSCRASLPASRHRLTNATAVQEVGGRSYALAWRHGADAKVETVVLSLDAAGALTITPVPVPYAEPLAFAVDSGGLVIVSVATRGVGTLLRVAFAEDGGLRPGKPTRAPEVAWGWPSAVHSDGVQATVEHALATPEQGIGGTAIYTIDLATLRVTATAKLTTGRIESHCHAGACTSVEVEPPPDEKTPARASLVQRIAGKPDTRLELEFRSTCPTFYPVPTADGLLLVAPGEPWRAVYAQATAPFLREVALDPTLAPQPGCPHLMHPFPSPTRPGLLQDAGTLLRWDGQRFGASEPAPTHKYQQAIRTSHPDGVIEVGWTGGHGMMHSPTDASGMRRYFSHWSFEGGAARLLRHEHGSWAALEPMPLALAGAEGTFHDGYAPIVLRHGLHAAVLLTPDGGGDEAYFQPYLAPCP